MKQVLIKPLWDLGTTTSLWDATYPWTFQKWRDEAALLGIALKCWHEMPLDRADCVWLLDLPDTKREFVKAKKLARRETPFVLQVIESPVGRAHNFIEENQKLCDYVVTYQHHLSAKENYFFYRLPHSLGGFHGMHLPFEEKRSALMVNTNRVEGWFATRKPGIVGLPGIGRNLSGWKMPLWSWFDPAQGELYSWRRALARVAETMDAGILDIIGPGWSGERISWFPLYPKKPYQNLLSQGTHAKLEAAARYRFCISVENYRGVQDYISEKILDPLLAGSVPVYLGDERITEVVPSNAFVDVRSFKNQRELLKYLHSCSKQEWEKMYDAGQLFLRSETANEFRTETYIQKMNNVLLKILSLPHHPKLGTASVAPLGS